MTRKAAVGWTIAIVLLLLLMTGAGLYYYYSTQQPAGGAAGQSSSATPPAATTTTSSPAVTFVTWNLRGYPEKDAASRAWFSGQLLRLKPDLLCVQEIASRGKVDQFLASERGFSWAAFVDSPDSQDNAIFGTSGVGHEDLPDPQGFQHPAQAAYVWAGGFDAVVVTVHLSWTNTTLREKEKGLLRSVVTEMLKKDPDVMVVGDFNTEGADIRELASSIGLRVMDPTSQTGTTHAGHHYDWFLISPDLADEEAIDCHVETFSSADLATATAVSDHLPVVARFRTDEKFRDRAR
jgi:endonuclease/exonuclease/phosphatase family metal-dependent hydrolase